VKSAFFHSLASIKINMAALDRLLRKLSIWTST